MLIINKILIISKIFIINKVNNIKNSNNLIEKSIKLKIEKLFKLKNCLSPKIWLN